MAELATHAMRMLRISGLLTGVLGLVFGLWYLLALSIVLLTVGRNPILALVVAFLADILFGSLPLYPYIYPFSMGALVLVLSWEIIGGRLRFLSKN